MIYTILAAKQADDTIITVVEYNLSGKVFEEVITHFQPKTAQEVIDGIENRHATVEIKETSKVSCKSIIDELQVGVKVEK